jgi:S-adenosylmethionine/arginine decarboxylase-like enzyme
VFNPIHQHFLATALLEFGSVISEREIREFLLRLVDAVGMQVLDGPLTAGCEDLGNEGVTGFVLLSTSHASLHQWDRGGPEDRPYFNFDLYSCREFNPQDILDMLAESFQPIEISHQIIRREPSPAVSHLGYLGFRLLLWLRLLCGA